MNKRAFDLSVAVVVGVLAAMALPRLWATRRMQDGTGGTGTAVVKVVTA
jgi:hypothetical protein